MHDAIDTHGPHDAIDTYDMYDMYEERDTYGPRARTARRAASPADGTGGGRRP
ncbi:hypothetical protein [Streptomyces sp. NPDC014734]|uniref:hypothetical protein n=1 Tax=Streptomyces sp. NPDC014734 TaxID=3364886 RepID=UPI0036FE0A00